MTGKERKTASVHKNVTLILQAILGIGVVFAILQGRFLVALSTAGIMVVTVLPVMLGRRFNVRIPPEFEALAVVFIYASLFF